MSAMATCWWKADASRRESSRESVFGLRMGPSVRVEGRRTMAIRRQADFKCLNRLDLHERLAPAGHNRDIETRIAREGTRDQAVEA